MWFLKKTKHKTHLFRTKMAIRFGNTLLFENEENNFTENNQRKGYKNGIHFTCIVFCCCCFFFTLARFLLWSYIASGCWRAQALWKLRILWVRDHGNRNSYLRKVLYLCDNSIVSHADCYSAACTKYTQSKAPCKSISAFDETGRHFSNAHQAMTNVCSLHQIHQIGLHGVFFSVHNKIKVHAGKCHRTDKLNRQIHLEEPHFKTSIVRHLLSHTFFFSPHTKRLNLWWLINWF